MRLRESFRKAGRKPDLGRCCLRFRCLGDLPLDAIGRLIASTPPEEFIRYCEEAHRQRQSPPAS